MNSLMKMSVPPWQTKWLVVELNWNPTVMEAFGYADEQMWGPSHIWGKFKTHTINLN
jgi:hypothetical protein